MTKQLKKRDKVMGNLQSERNVRSSLPTASLAQKESVREFIKAMSAELAELAYRNGLDSLAVAFDTAREIAIKDENELAQL